MRSAKLKELNGRADQVRKLRLEGASNRVIAETLTADGFPISTASVSLWLKREEKERKAIVNEAVTSHAVGYASKAIEGTVAILDQSVRLAKRYASEAMRDEKYIRPWEAAAGKVIAATTTLLGAANVIKPTIQIGQMNVLIASMREAYGLSLADNANAEKVVEAEAEEPRPARARAFGL